MADFTFAVIAIDWGFSASEVALRLFELSEKARAYGLDYANLTATKAANTVAARGYTHALKNGPR